jgi:hypothetical protein
MWGRDDITLFTVGLSVELLYREKPTDPPRFT